MGLILKIHDDEFKKDNYLEWSTIQDQPLTNGCSLKEFLRYYKKEYGRRGVFDLKNGVLDRVEKTGSSGALHGYSLESIFKNNRCGRKEKCLDKEGILKKYCRPRYKERKD